VSRIVVTGAAGFIGSHLCEALLARGDSVVGIDNLSTGDLHNIAHLRAMDFEFIRHDVTQYIDVDGQVDYVLHWASPASPIDYLELPIQTLKVGSLGTHNALGLAKAKGAKFVLASTSEVYGDPLVHPQQETYWGNVNPIGPRGVYDEAKRFAEAITLAYHRTHGVDTKIVRIFNTYGPRMRLRDGRAVPAFVSQALANEDVTVFGDGTQTRSFCYVSDLVRGILSLMDANTNEPVNIGNPHELTIEEIARTIVRLVGSRSQIVYRPLPVDDPKQRQPDITRARTLLGWQPEVSLEDGLRTAIEYFKTKVAEGTQVGRVLPFRPGIGRVPQQDPPYVEPSGILREPVARDARVPIHERAVRVLTPRPHVQLVERVQSKAIRAVDERECLT
jgi:dTDP-glucose 4,6-dehydratase